MKNKMKQTIFHRFTLLLVGGCVLAGITGQAQQGQGGGQRISSSASRNSTYPNKTDIGQARITYDPETRSLIVVSDDETAGQIKDMVKQLDRPTPQVLIKCVFLEATYNKGLDLGVDGTYKHTINSQPFTSGTAATAFDLVSSGGMYTLMGKDLEITIAALSTAGKTEILSRPSILARNNQQATITVGQQVPLISGVTYDSFGNQRNAITYQNVGIILKVTPFITSDGFVEMIVAPEISSVSDSTVSFTSGIGTNNVGGSSAPIINIRSADTVVVTPDKQTIVIGGLMATQKQKKEEKVPLLGDIPVLGWLFKHNVDSDVKTELLIFLTPTIVKDQRDIAMMTDSEKSNARGSRKAFSEEELNRYLDTVPLAAPKASVPPPKSAPASKPAKSPKATE